MNPLYIIFGVIVCVAIIFLIGFIAGMAGWWNVFWRRVHTLKPLEAVEVCRLLYKAGLLKTNIDVAMEKKRTQPGDEATV